MCDVGVYVYDVRFSGFSSQGDGASFEGYISDFSRFWDKHSLVMPLIRDRMDQVTSINFRWEIGGTSYVHSMMMLFHEFIEFEDPEFEDPLRQAAWEAARRELDKEWETFVATATGLLRGHVDQLYHDLETEYDYLTSDEQILESLIANDHLEQALERYEPDSSEEGDESQDAAFVQELLLRTPGAVLEAG